MKRLALVDDDDEFRGFLCVALKAAGDSVADFPTGGKFLDGVVSSRPDLALVDLELPGLPGWDLIRVLRANAPTRTLPILVISGRYTDSKEIVRALESGADDFVAKPVDRQILLARVDSLLRRAAWRDGPPAGDRLRIGDLALDEDEHRVRLEGAELQLTPLEFGLLHCLMKNPNRVLTRGVLLEQVWKLKGGIETRTVDRRVESLREKLGRFGERIQTVSGVGYCLRP